MRSQQENSNRISQTMNALLKNLSEVIDVNTVVGCPIKMQDGDYVVPISKVTVGVLTGGGEYGKISIFKNSEDLPFSAGNGAIVSIKPSGFLVKEQDKYKIIGASPNSYEKILDKASDLIMDLKNEK